MAAAVSKLVHLDWPEEWEELFHVLIQNLKSGQQDLIHGSLQVFSEFVKDDMTETQFPSMAPILLPELLVIFENTDMDVTIRLQALTILSDMIETIYMLKEEHPQVVHQYVQPIAASWIEPLRIQLSVEASNDFLLVNNEAVKLLLKLNSYFPKLLDSDLPMLLEVMYCNLTNWFPEYMKFADFGESHINFNQMNNDYSSSITSYLYSILQFLQSASRRKSLSSTFLCTALNNFSFLTHLSIILISYLRITEEMESSWSIDMNQLLKDENDDNISINARIAIQETFSTLLDQFPFQTSESILVAIAHLIQTANSEKAAGSEYWWKIYESCFLTLERNQIEIMECISSGKVQFELEFFFRSTVLACLDLDNVPYLAGRALCVASKFAEYLPEILEYFVNHSFKAIMSEHVPAPVRILSLKAVHNFIHVIPSETIQSSVGQLFEAIIQLAYNSKEETLSLLLETLIGLVKINVQVADRHQLQIIDFAMNVWKNCFSDFVLVDIVEELISELIKIPSISHNLELKIIPALRDCLNLNNKPPIVLVSCAIELLSNMISNSSSPVSSMYASEIYPRVIHIAMTVDDTGVLQSAQELFKVLLSKDFQGIFHCDFNGRNGLEMLVSFIAKALDPAQSESGVLFIGDLISKLILKSGDLLTPILQDLLYAVLNRLESAEMPSFIQSLILVFARMIQSHCEPLVEYLKGIVVNEKNGLSVLLGAWMEYYDSIQGHFELKLCTVSMITIFKSVDPFLNEILVKGDLIVNSHKSNEKFALAQYLEIMTRSRTKVEPNQYTIVTFPTKVIKLLLAEWLNQPEKKSNGVDNECENFSFNIDNYFDGDEDDWEEIQDDDDEEEEENNMSVWTAEFEDATEVDPDVLADPIYQLNLKNYISDFLKTCEENNFGGFSSIVETQLSPNEKETLMIILRK